MGRRNAEYDDPAIGLLSHYSQLWIDRNFSLDYALKSVLKVTRPEVRKRVVPLRAAMKDAAYWLLGAMVHIVRPDARGEDSDPEMIAIVDQLAPRWDPTMRDVAANEAVLADVLDVDFARLSGRFAEVFESVRAEIPDRDQETIVAIVERWRKEHDWRLINVA